MRAINFDSALPPLAKDWTHELLLFSKIEPSIPRDPHAAVILYIRRLIGSGTNVPRIKRNVRSILCSHPPGLGFDHVGSIGGHFDDEYMPQEGLAPFKEGTAFWVSYEDFTRFDEVLYSREELCGWLTLGLLQAEVLTQSHGEFSNLMNSLWTRESSSHSLLSKLDGKQSWFHGPVGKKFSEADKAEWDAFHVAGFSNRYL